MNDSKNNNKILVLIAFMFILSGTILYATFNQKQNPDIMTDEQYVSDSSKQANIVDDSDSIVNLLGGVVQYNLLSEDIFYFGKVTYESYRKNISKTVGFRIDGNIQKKDSNITFTGNYGASKNKISVSITVLANKRIKTSIYDTKLNKNIDSELPSNSKFNQFISTLPISRDSYTIEYSKSEDKVVISLTDRDPSILPIAEKYIESQIDDGSLNSDKIINLFPPNSYGN